MTVGTDSYISTLQFQAYCTSRGITIPTTIEPLLIKASDYITSTFYGYLIGTKKVDTQPLLFPRIDDYGNDIDETNLIKAVSILALKSESMELFEDTTKRVIEERLDVITVKYDTNSTDKTQFSEVNSLMRVYMNGGTNSLKVLRG